MQKRSACDRSSDDMTPKILIIPFFTFSTTVLHQNEKRYIFVSRDLTRRLEAAVELARLQAQRAVLKKEAQQASGVARAFRSSRLDCRGG